MKLNHCCSTIADCVIMVQLLVIHPVWLHRTLNLLYLSNDGERQNCNVKSEKLTHIFNAGQLLNAEGQNRLVNKV